MSLHPLGGARNRCHFFCISCAQKRQGNQARLRHPRASQLTLKLTPISFPNTSVQHYNSGPWFQKRKWHVLWTLNLDNPHHILERTTLCHRFWFNSNALATKFTGFSICHPVYDDTRMLKCMQHSLRFAMCSELPTATFLFLPNWENKNINAYRALVRDNPKYCTTLGFIPKTKLTYARPTSDSLNSPTTPGAWILLLSVIKKQNSI